MMFRFGRKRVRAVPVMETGGRVILHVSQGTRRPSPESVFFCTLQGEVVQPSRPFATIRTVDDGWDKNTKLVSLLTQYARLGYKLPPKHKADGEQGRLF